MSDYIDWEIEQGRVLWGLTNRNKRDILTTGQYVPFCAGACRPGADV